MKIACDVFLYYNIGMVGNTLQQIKVSFLLRIDIGNFTTNIWMISFLYFAVQKEHEFSRKFNSQMSYV